ncbi:S41 family peptidase [Prosthecobacter sp.]|uniref:S41 family peptidase n=1 Tax=Prosthecobacter sp. TaxID=1965333 RepID=UPI002ABA24A6|nr:S41 family peptidase [Prosthecobacter sp.]MDZ4405007.1 S41 family peptidase [Prosthecobacter sp.]
MTGNGHRNTWVLAVTLAGVLFTTSHARAQVDDRELGAAVEILHECSSVIEKRCYYPLTVPVVMTRALAELHKAGAAPGADAPPPPDLTQKTEAEAVQGARAHLSQLAVLPGQRLTPAELAEAALAAYCRTIDPYTRYETTDDAARIDKARATPGSGIGMSLKERDGSYYCYPFPDSVAALSGIRPGDKLISVDGRPVKGESVDLLATRIKGPPGTPVNLRIEKSTGRAQLLPVIREAGTAAPAFLIDQDTGGVVLRVRRFEPGIGAQVSQALASQTTTRLMTVDLRGNQGGSLMAAVELASLFLDTGAEIVTVVERGFPNRTFLAEKPALIKPAQISILQDEGTASASEIFIAALVMNIPQRAASQGSKTYGKGVLQLVVSQKNEGQEQGTDIVTLKGGGVLTLTTGMMFAKGGISWNETGLQPSTTTPGGKIFTENAVSITNTAMRPKPVVKLVD